MKQRYDQCASEALHTQSLADERLSKEAYNEEDYAGAIAKIQLAIEGQNAINELFGLSTHRNVNRIAQLKRALEHYKVYPLHIEIQDLEKSVSELIKSEKWIEAAELMDEIIEKQLFLNSEFRSSNLANSFKVNNFRLQEVTYRSEPFTKRLKDILPRRMLMSKSWNIEKRRRFMKKRYACKRNSTILFLKAPIILLIALMICWLKVKLQAVTNWGELSII